MPRSRAEPELPPCYAMVFPGLEEVAAEEITRDLGGDVRKTGAGYVVFRVAALDQDVLRLRTSIVETRAASVIHEYHVLRDDLLLAKGRSVLACIDRQGRLQRLPETLFADCGAAEG